MQKQEQKGRTKLDRNEFVRTPDKLFPSGHAIEPASAMRFRRYSSSTSTTSAVFLLSGQSSRESQLFFQKSKQQAESFLQSSDFSMEI